MMKMLKKVSEQRGTLLVEALAMLGLIATVTPTLYKKSAERLNEIQDINAASQARIMSNVIDTFMKANKSALMSELSSVTGTIRVDYAGGNPGAFNEGYSSYLPYGYKPDEIRAYGAPRVYVHRDHDTLISYVIYPKLLDIGKKRAARMASLVGANGGVISATKEALGTGGAWYLDPVMVEDMEFDSSAVQENALIITSNEPVTLSYEDNAKYLYRVPPGNGNDSEGEYYKNTMVTDLYMGGIYDDATDYGAYGDQHYYSIFNVKKMTMNTDCDRHLVAGIGASTTAHCDPNVADLYIGKPFVSGSTGSGGTLHENQYSPGAGTNNGAAWIYGNLSALSDSFKLFRASDSSDVGDFSGGYDGDLSRAANSFDVMQFMRNSDDNVEAVVMRLENDGSSLGARASFMNDFVQIFEKTQYNIGGSSSSLASPQFVVGDANREMIYAHYMGGDRYLRLSRDSDAITYINENGGVVEINGGSAAAQNVTKVNYDNGGNLYMGKLGAWMTGEGRDNSSRVALLRNVGITGAGESDQRIFTVGADETDANAKTGTHMFYGDSELVSLENQGLRVYKDNKYADDTHQGGIGGIADYSSYGTGSSATLSGLTTIGTRFVDIFGRTYLGTKAMQLGSTDDGFYDRSAFTLGVAGSAWIDDLLWARQAWFKEAGIQELHAGFKNYAEYSAARKNGWLNAYEDKVVIRNKDKGSSDTEGNPYGATPDAMLWADSSRIILNDTYGATAWLEGGTARIGNGTEGKENYFFADSSNSGSANVVGHHLVNLYTTQSGNSSTVNIQRDAMIFSGHWDGNDYANHIAAQAGLFTIRLGDNASSSAERDAHFVADASSGTIYTRYVDFMVESNSSKAVFKVRPNVGDNEDAANVRIDGSLQVTGNDVIHVRSKHGKTAEEDSSRAMFEIDPEYIAVWSKDSDGNYVGAHGGLPNEYYAMFKVAATDTDGTAGIDSSSQASVYIRKGAIELEQSYKPNGDSDIQADGGYGYIKANRFVSNAGQSVPETLAAEGYVGDTAYDQYMVNPAYTSVMHDIKLTTRGGARLSDILPDFVLKGIYNVNNNFPENTTAGPTAVSNIRDFSKWASPFLGAIPYASCPPGYRNMATIVPISFMMGQAGEIVPKSLDSVSHWVVQNGAGSRQASVLKNNTTGIVYPNFHQVDSTVYNGLVGDFVSSMASDVKFRPEGWYLGFKADLEDDQITPVNNVTGGDTDVLGIANNEYEPVKSGTEKYAIAHPLYFQQNTWLKTSLDPFEKGWYAYMGFLYEKSAWGDGFTQKSGGADVSNTGQAAPVRSNYNDAGYNDVASGGGESLGDGYVWNLFPVPTNSLEGHATVYCFFDRSQFQNWGDGNLVDQIDQLEALRNGDSNFREIGKKDTNSDYVKRLNDETLKYKDPW